MFPDEEESFEFLPRYNKIISGKTKITKEQAEKLQASNRLTQLEEDMSEIKTMLRQLVSKEMSNGS